jgi:hypothetical protein
MLLAAIPGQVGDGAKVTVGNRILVAGTEGAPAAAGDLRRHLFGEARLPAFPGQPEGLRDHGITETPDGRALFVDVQHAGEESKSLAQPQSLWPGRQQGLRPPG